MKYAVFDTEIIGNKNPKFLLCVKIGPKKHALWMHKRNFLNDLKRLMNQKLTWVGFNSENFDRPLIATILDGYDVHAVKNLATVIIEQGMKSWQTYSEYNIPFVEYDHIDLIEVAPGVMISLKTYAGRLGHKTLVDIPFGHDHDLTPAEEKSVETYCWNDIDVTEELLKTLKTEMDLRVEMSEEYGIDLRSKSDAQMSEAILKKRAGIRYAEKQIPMEVRYKTPSFIKTSNKAINALIEQLENHRFTINRGNGSPEAPAFLDEVITIGKGTYQCGIGGLHSTHDVNLYAEASNDLMLSDFDVASYYPNIMFKAGIFPPLEGNKGIRFVEEYRHIYETRMEAKKAGNKKVANSLKILINGAFGKLGSVYCSFYAPELLLAVTITGQLNLLSLIAEIEKNKGVRVLSANTDGILVAYPPTMKDAIQKKIDANAKRTGFIYEETPYLKYGAKDCNNYIAIKTNGEAKRKGLYASTDPKQNPLFLMKNPTMEVCGNMAVEYLVKGTLPEWSIKEHKDIRDFVAIRNVKGGGIQYDKYVMVDDWYEVGERLWTHEGRTAQPVKRKSRPAPRMVGKGGKPFGRVARWYMTKEPMPSLSYIGSGNQVPKTEGARVCMTLPSKLPADLDKQWYIDETYRILTDLGVPL